MILWITLIIFLISLICCCLCKTNQIGQAKYGKIGKFFDEHFPTVLISAAISGFLTVIILICLMIVHIEFSSLVAERNAVQMTLNEYRKNADISVLEKVGAIQQAFEINKEIGVAKYWHGNFWTGVFWPDSVVELEYIK